VSEKRDVLVYDRVPTMAAVSVAQVEAYLRRTGWTLTWIDDTSFAYDVGYWTRGKVHDLAVRRDEFFGDCIEGIADLEQRQPSAVLVDIAAEPP
jgi:hypothetical protein